MTAAVAQAPPVTLRALAFVDRMGPQYAAYWGLMAQGALPVPGMAQLIVEVSPANAAFGLADAALKAAAVHSAGTLIERDFGLLELHAPAPDVVLEARSAILERLGQQVADRVAPEVVSSQRISRLEAYHSQLFNKIRRGAWTLPGDTLCVLEVTPAAWVYPLANEIEKAVEIELVRVAGTGLFGRLIVAGTEAQAEAAERTAMAVIESIRAEATPAGSGG